MPLDENQTCFLSGKPIVDIPGQVADLPAWLIGCDDAALLAAGKSGVCYVKYLVSSPLSGAWAIAVRRYLKAVGCRQIHDTHGLEIFMNPRTRVATVLFDNGTSFDILPTDTIKSSAKSGNCVKIWRTIEYNFSNKDRDLIQSIQRALISEGFFAFQKFAQSLGVTDCFYQDEVIGTARFIFHRSLKRYWSSHSVSCHLHFPLLIPGSIAKALVEARIY